MKNNRKGFTLIELLVVIAIIAVLAVVVVLTLNPAELLRQARDSNRLSDFATLKSALSLYATDVVTSTNLNGTAGMTGNGAYDLYLYQTSGNNAPTAMATYNTTSTVQGSWGFLGGEAAATTTAQGAAGRAVNGTGWIPVNFGAISSGAPLAALPVDPSNSYGGTASSSLYAYVYAASSTVYKLTTRMESTKYVNGGGSDVESTDGGSNPVSYEQGTAVGTL